MTLSEFSLQLRIIAKLLAFMAAGVLAFYLIILLLISTFRKPEQPKLNLNPVYGSIKAPVFEEGIGTEKYDFVLDTIDGKYPNTTVSAAVYYIPEPKSTLAYLTKVDNLAQSFDFDTSVYKPQTLNDQWVKYEDDSRILEVNIVSSHFKYYFKAGSGLQDIIEATPEAKFTLLENDFIQRAREELVNREAYPTYIAAGTNNPVYQTFDLATGRFIPYEEGAYPQAVRIDFFRQDEVLNILTPHYFSSQNYVILSPLTYYPRVVQMQFLSYDKLNDEPGIYPLLTSEEAFTKLKKGEATVISVTEPGNGQIKVKKIDIGYYDAQTYQPYFQPAFVFLGDHNFVAYLPAIRDEYLVK